MANISRKTLRWWVENGLIECEKDQTNGYHLFNINSLYDVCDIKFLQKAGLSLEQIKNRESYEMDCLSKLYNAKYDDLNDQIKALINAQKIVKEQIETLGRIKEKQKTEITWEEPPFDYIEKLSIWDEELVDIRLNHNCSDVTFDSKRDGVFLGISSNTKLTEKPVWKKSENSEFLKMIAKQHNETIFKTAIQDRENHLIEEEFYAKVKQIDETIYIENYIPKSIIEKAPNKSVSEKLLEEGKTLIEIKTLKEVMDNLLMLGFDLKSIIFVWLINTCENGVKYRYFDVYLEY